MDNKHTSNFKVVQNFSLLYFLFCLFSLLCSVGNFKVSREYTCQHIDIDKENTTEFWGYALMSTVLKINLVLCVWLPISWMPHVHILLVPTTLSYSAKYYHRPSSYAYCFNRVSQRGTSMPPVQRNYGDLFYLNNRTSISGRQGKQIYGLLL